MSAPHTTPDQKKRIHRTILIIAAVVALFFGLFLNKLYTPLVLTQAELSANGAVEFDNPRIIEPFELVNHQGEPFTLEDLEGQWTLMYFGFATCPDICPMTLSQLAQMMDGLTNRIAANTQVVLVSVDPARDTPEVLKEYMAHFNPDFIGVTGEFLPIKRLADNLNVAFNRVVTGDDYTVDHTGNIVLINPYGHYHGILRPPFELSRMKLTYQSIVTAF